MAKLTETATTILSAAAARDDHRVLPLPKLKTPPVAVHKSLKSLLATGLIDEIAANRDDEVWKQSGEEGRRTLVITAEGLAAIGIEAETTNAELAKGRAKPAKGRTRGRSTGKPSKGAKKASRARTTDGGKKESKQAKVIALLRRANGASIEEMMEATDWQAHSVRGIMSGALKKRLKLEVVSEKDKKAGERRYYVAAIK